MLNRPLPVCTVTLPNASYISGNASGGGGFGVGVGVGVGIGEGAQAVSKRRAANATARIVTPGCSCLVILFSILPPPLIASLTEKGHQQPLLNSDSSAPLSSP